MMDGQSGDNDSRTSKYHIDMALVYSYDIICPHNEVMILKEMSLILQLELCQFNMSGISL